MKTIIVAAVLGVMLSAPAHAENWMRVGSTNDGTILELDMDSIHKLPGGNTSVNTASGGKDLPIIFDCKGRALMFGEWRRAPGGSFLAQMSQVVCDPDTSK